MTATAETPVPSLFAALAKAQAKIMAAKKDSKNPHFNSKYADLASVWEACRDALTEQGICVIQEPLSADGKVGCVTTLGHASGESRTSPHLWTAPRDQGPQAIGSCITYLRRYQLAAMVGVAPEDDDGNAGVNGSASANGKPAPAPRANTVKHDGKKASAEQVKLLHTLKGKVGGMTEDAYRKQLAAFKDSDGNPVTTSTDLSPEQIDNLIGRYKAKIDQQEKRAQEAIGEAIGHVNGDPHRADNDDGEPAADESKQAILSAAKELGPEHEKTLPVWLDGLFGVQSVEALTQKQADSAYLLLSAFRNKAQYQQLLREMAERNEVRI